MKKQTIQYTSPFDALIAVARRLSAYEDQHQMDSESFFDQYSRGQLSDDAVFVLVGNKAGLQPLDTIDQMESIVGGIENKRLRYRDLVA